MNVLVMHILKCVLVFARWLMYLSSLHFNPVERGFVGSEEKALSIIIVWRKEASSSRCLRKAKGVPDVAVKALLLV